MSMDGITGGEVIEKVEEGRLSLQDFVVKQDYGLIIRKGIFAS
jgi:hypothetical protein